MQESWRSKGGWRGEEEADEEDEEDEEEEEEERLGVAEVAEEEEADGSSLLSLMVWCRRFVVEVYVLGVCVLG